MKIKIHLCDKGIDEFHERVYIPVYWKNAIYKPTHIGVGSNGS